MTREGAEVVAHDEIIMGRSDNPGHDERIMVTSDNPRHDERTMVRHKRSQRIRLREGDRGTKGVAHCERHVVRSNSLNKKLKKMKRR